MTDVRQSVEIRFAAARLLLGACLAGAALSGTAAPVGAARAAEAVRARFASGVAFGTRLVGGVARVTRHAAGTNGFFAVRLTDGGTVIVADDDHAEPIVAFTTSTNAFEDLAADHPLRALISHDIPLRIAAGGRAARWRRFAAANSLTAAKRSSAPDDLRVAPLVETRWSQSGSRQKSCCFNWYTPNGSDPAAFTPGASTNVVCGCVATAMAQILRYHSYPTASQPVDSETVACQWNERNLSLTMQGGTYDWDQMPTDGANDRISTDDQCRAIGKLASDVGISVAMDYNQYNSGGSGTYLENAPSALVDVWHYAQAAVFYDYAEDGYGYLDGEKGAEARARMLQNVILANLDAGYPVLLGIYGSSSGGHAIVADGYGYDADDVDYVHLNMGWSGEGDCWYNLPDIDAGVYRFTTVYNAGYNIMPTNGPNEAILSGRLTDTNGLAVAGALVTLSNRTTSAVTVVTSSSNGVYAAILPAGTYAVSAELSDSCSTLTARRSAVSLAAPVFSNDFEDLGYRIVRPGETETGNSWGNDLVLSSDSQPEPEPEPEPEEEPIVYVDVANTRGNPDGTVTNPYPTIAEGLAAADDGDTVLVRPGRYPECVVAPSGKTLKILSSGGPEETVIDARYTDSCYRGGNNAATLLAGFTLDCGAYCGGAYGGTISNCIIQNCSASYVNRRQRYYGAGGGAYGATLYDSVIRDCTARNYGGGAAASVLVRCTVYGNKAAAGSGVDADSRCTDSIVCENYSTSGARDNWESYQDGPWGGATAFANSCTAPSGFQDGGGNVTDDPRFVSLDHDDFRLREDSPCLGAASDGRNMGAWQGTGLPGHLLVARGEQGRVEPSYALVEEGGSATFTAQADHVLVGFETNGVTAVSDGVAFTWTNVTVDGELVAHFAPTNFYVDAETGDDANTGWSWETPLKSVMRAAEVVQSGESVFVRPGTYYASAEIEATNVTLIATDGDPRKTVIDAGEDGGLCLYVSGSAAVSGFTLAHGDCSDGHYYGGATWGGTFTNCILRDSSSYCGGGAYNATLVNCVISNCTALNSGGGAIDCTLRNCLVAGNGATYDGGGAYECDLYGCTLVTNRAGEYGGGAYLGNARAWNSLFALNASDRGYDYGNDIYGNGFWTKIATLCDFADVASVGFVDAARGDWHLSARSPALDAGSNDFVSVAHDLDGTNRIYGARVDIGCYEYVHLPEGWPAPEVQPGASAEEEAAAVSDSLKKAGFPAETAATVTTLVDYNKVTSWAESRGVAVAEQAASPTALLSPALDAAGLLELTSNDVAIASLAIATNASAGCVATLTMPLKAYDAAKADLSLLKAAVGVTGAAKLGDTFTSDDLAVDVRKGAEAVEIVVMPPAGSERYFLRARVR